MRARLRSLPLVAMVLALGAPLTGQAASAAEGKAPSTPPPKAATPTLAASANTLTLFSEPGFGGRRAVYHTPAVEVERQGFAARSAFSTGMWTLCEGGQVVSRCQTVDGQAPELKFAPQLVRPGLNALALYEEPGLKGRRIIYSFAADRPAPFHARSARTWGGPWSVCERDFQRCQTLDGKSASLDLVVGAVRPKPGGVRADAPAAAPVIPVRAVNIPTPRAPKPLPVSQSRPPKALPFPARSEHTKASLPARPLRRSRLVHVTSPARASAPPPRHLIIQVIDEPSPRHHHETRTYARSPVAGALRRIPLTPVRSQARVRRPPAATHARDVRMVRDQHPVRRVARGGLVHPVSDRHVRKAHAPRRRLYRHVRMMWGGPDPYLYDADPRDYGPEPW